MNNNQQLENFFEVTFYRETQGGWKAKDIQTEFFFDKHQKLVIGSGTYGQIFREILYYQAKFSNKNQKLILSSMRSRKLKYFMKKKEQILINFLYNQFPITALREIKFLKSLKHPNIMNIKDINIKRKVKNGIRRIKTYCVLDFMDLDVFSVVQLNFKQKKTMPPEIIQTILHQVKILLQQIVKEFAWFIIFALKKSDPSGYQKQTKKILKPLGANILISLDGEVKIADFGLAKYIPISNFLRRTPTVVTLNYRAPEVLFTKGIYDFKIDIWSLGCFAFELAFNYTLFNARNEQEHVKQMVEICGTPKEDTWPGITKSEVYSIICPQKVYERRLISHIRSKNIDIDDDLLDLIDRMLIMNPQSRITIEQALNHNYFSKYNNKIGIENLKNYAELLVSCIKESKEIQFNQLNLQKPKQQQQQQLQQKISNNDESPIIVI